MSKKTHRSNAERFGRWLGGMWCAYARHEHEAVAWLVARGMASGAANAALWTIKLGVLAVLFYVTFWLALIIVFLIVVAPIAAKTSTLSEGEWRNGPEGHGYYESGVRTDYGRIFEGDDE
ncbi:DUF3742 family protein [Pseudomonas aeruginosa]|uniref:DUF3742 family protein n=1 Tax=Pseudomonas aeruginosa TaxID=287 RepID=UPI0031B6C8D1